MGAAELTPTANRSPWGLGHVVVGFLLAEAAVVVALVAFDAVGVDAELDDLSLEAIDVFPVSYTHLTLPTILLV